MSKTIDELIESITVGLLGKEDVSSRISISVTYRTGTYAFKIHGRDGRFPGGHDHRLGSEGHGASKDPVEAMEIALSKFVSDMETHTEWKRRSVDLTVKSLKSKEGLLEKLSAL